MSSKNIVTVAEKAVENHPTLENVIIMERTERCDKKDADPCSIKAQLSTFANAEFDRLLSVSKHKEKIKVGKHKFDSSAESRDRRFGRATDKHFDGIHLNGTSGKSDYTDSVLNILSEASLCKKPFHRQSTQNSAQNRRTTSQMSNRRQLSNQHNRIPPVWISQYNYPSHYNKQSNSNQFHQNINHNNNLSQHNSAWSQQNYRQSQQNMGHNYRQPRPVLLPTPPSDYATGGNREPLNNIYNAPTFNRFKACLLYTSPSPRDS